MPLTARSDSIGMPKFAATCASVSPGRIRYACHDTSGWSTRSSFAAKSSALSIGQQDRVFVGAGDHRPVVLRVEVQELLERHFRQSAARLTSIFSVVFTTAK